jgi:hypothetical protein
MATLLKILNNLADIRSAGGVALQVRTQGPAADGIAHLGFNGYRVQVSYGAGGALGRLQLKSKTIDTSKTPQILIH